MNVQRSVLLIFERHIEFRRSRRANEPTLFQRCDVDKIEDAKFLSLNKAQQLSTSRPDLIETEHVENRGFLLEPGNRLGHRYAPFWRIFRFNNLANHPC